MTLVTRKCLLQGVSHYTHMSSSWRHVLLKYFVISSWWFVLILIFVEKLRGSGWAHDSGQYLCSIMTCSIASYDRNHCHYCPQPGLKDCFRKWVISPQPPVTSQQVYDGMREIYRSALGTIRASAVLGQYLLTWSHISWSFSLPVCSDIFSI